MLNTELPQGFLSSILVALEDNVKSHLDALTKESNLFFSPIDDHNDVQGGSSNCSKLSSSGSYYFENKAYNLELFDRM